MTKLFLSLLCAVTFSAVFSGNIPLSVYAESEESVTSEEILEINFSLGDMAFPEIHLPESPVFLSNYSEKSYNYRDCLDANNLAVYEAMSALTIPSATKITVKLPEEISIILDHMPGSSNATEEDEETFRNAVFSNCRSGIDGVLFDMPEIFWLDEAKLSIGIGDSSTKMDFFTRKYKITIKSLTFTPACREEFGTMEKVAEYKTLLEKAVADFEVDGENRYEQIKSIHDKICLMTTYDETADFRSSVIGTLIGGASVCEGYSKTFKIICDRLDIPCIIAIGNFDFETLVAHMWNYVQMDDGNWYAVDVTWDDLNGRNGLELKYEYLLKGTESFNVRHTPESNYYDAYIVYPELSPTDYIPPVFYDYGDLNHDGKVSIADLVYCSECVMGKISAEFSCDLNGDGLADSFDVTLMRQLVISL
ncbi:MAG: hypothetical protein K2J08_05700 [Ruminococcus sp.]|nr:hypothetical protein [Ruminococcus sp.]